MIGALGPRLLILSAPSGAGKTTLAQSLVAALPGSRLSVSLTTRAPRGSEQDGREYHFVSAEYFREQIAAGELLEWAEVHGQLYGTPRRSLAAGLPNAWTIFDIDVQGGKGLAAQFPGAVLIFVLPPSFAVLEERLRGRRTESEAAIQSRLAASREEIRQGLHHYRYAVINRELGEALRDVVSIARAEALRLEATRGELEAAFGDGGLREK